MLSPSRANQSDTTSGQPDGATAVDYTVNAAAGFPLATGPEDADGPINHVLPAWDIATGLSAAFGLLAALLTGCTTTRADGSPQIQTSSQANRESLEGAMSAPLRAQRWPHTEKFA